MTVMHSQYREPGQITVDEGTCTHCGQCVEICPADAIVLRDGHIAVNEASPFGCIACGHCMMTCPSGGIAVTGRGLSPGDLTPLPAREDRASADSLVALMQARRSVRKFTKQEVSAEELDRIVEMAASAPMGIPPWDVGCVAVSGREKVQALAVELVKGYEGFLRMFRPWVLTLMRPIMRRPTYEMFKFFIRPLAEMLIADRRQGRDTLFWDAPAVLIFYHSPYADKVDAMIPCTYAMLAAEALGLGTTMIGSAAPVLQRNKRLLAGLGIPDGHTPAMAMIVGHPATHFKRGIKRRFLPSPST